MPPLSTLYEHPGNDDNLAWIKLWLGVLALAALVYEASREADGVPVSLRIKKRVGLLFAVLGVLAYSQFFDIGYKDFYHRHELFHYYLGSKYFPEIGYEGIYTCAAVAESELPRGSASPRDEPARTVRTRRLRDLRVNLLTDTAPWVDHPELCKDGDAAEGRRAFTPQRWAAFKDDVAFFRRVSLGSDWKRMQEDHGYNPTPVWGLLGRFFSDLHPADVATMKWLSAIDPLLFAGLFAMVAWAFGWRVLCVSLAFFGFQDASPFYWTGGAFLRQDWLFFTIASACLLRKKYPFWGGAFLAYATLLRVFPLFFFAGWGVMALAHAHRVWRGRRAARIPLTFTRETFLALTPPALRRVAAGAALATAVLFTLTLPVAGLPAWKSFVHHIGVHNGTALTNHMGWKTVVSHSEAGRAQVAEDRRLSDPFQTWKSMRLERKHALAGVIWAGIAASMALFVWASWNLRSLWVVECLGILPAVVLVELTDYYYSFFLLAALLTRGRRPLEIALLVTAVGSEWCHTRFAFFDDRFVAMSLFFLVLAVFAVALYAPKPWRRALA